LRKAVITGRWEALRARIEEAKAEEVALMEREIELRDLQEALEQSRQDCQAWERRLRVSESQLQEREEKIKEREQALEKALQYLRTVSLKTGQEQSSSSVYTEHADSLDPSSSPLHRVAKISSPSAQPLFAIVLFTSLTDVPDELSISSGETLEVLEVYGNGNWVLCRNARGATGMVRQAWLETIERTEHIEAQTMDSETRNSVQDEEDEWVKELTVLVRAVKAHRESYVRILRRSSSPNMPPETEFERPTSDPRQAVIRAAASMSQRATEVSVSLQPEASWVQESNLLILTSGMAYSSAISSVQSSQEALDLWIKPFGRSTSLSRHQQAVLSRHILQWRELYDRRFLTWNDIPWPTFEFVELARPGKLKQEDVRIYLKLLKEFEYLSPSSKYMHQNSNDADKFLVEYTARWHPDRLEVRVYGRVVEQDKATVQIYANEVMRILREIAQTYGLEV
jgi:hypothetical protein